LCWGKQKKIKLKLIPAHLSMSLLHGPDADHDPAPHPDDPSELPEGPDSSLCRRDVMDDGHGQDGIEALIPKRKRQIITEHDLLEKRFWVL